MICGATGVMVLLACVGCSLARVLPPISLARISGDALTAKDTHTDRDALTRIEAHTSRNTLNLTIARKRRMEPNLRLNELDRSLFPDVPDYVFKNGKSLSSFLDSISPTVQHLGVPRLASV